MRIKQNDIVLVPFPFTDLSSSKVRPALVVSKNLGDDFILCGISSKSSCVNEIQITNDDLSAGELPVRSFVKIGKIVTLHSSLIRRSVASVRKDVALRILKKLVAQFI